MYDFLIKNGTVIDGGGAPPEKLDIAVTGSKIVKTGKDLGAARETIDASGLTVTPGFIDSHSHSDSAVLTFPGHTEKIQQGITTAVAGMCGGSAAPKPYLEDTPENAPYRSVKAFFEAAQGVPQGVNTALFVGHGNIRRAVMGGAGRQATNEELRQMRSLLREGLKQGAAGVSFGLIYAPGIYADTAELTETAKVAAEEGAVVSAHIRDEEDHLTDAVAEFISVIRASGARGVISHHKATGQNNFGRVRDTLRMIDEANALGLDIYCDVYPYTASSTTLTSAFVPPEYRRDDKVKQNLASPEIRKEIKPLVARRFAKRGSDYSWIKLISCDAYPELAGLTLTEAAKRHGRDEYDTAFDLLLNCKYPPRAVYFSMCEADVETVLSHPRAMICTDAGAAGNKTSFHPRTVGSFPRALGRYVRERGVTDLPEMIRKMTSLPAYVYGLEGKGLIRPGYDADICIFDAARITDRADYDNCAAKAQGLSFVLVGGKIAAEDAAATGVRNGKMIIHR